MNNSNFSALLSQGYPKESSRFYIRPSYSGNWNRTKRSIPLAVAACGAGLLLAEAPGIGFLPSFCSSLGIALSVAGGVLFFSQVFILLTTPWRRLYVDDREVGFGWLPFGFFTQKHIPVQRIAKVSRIAGTGKRFGFSTSRIKFEDENGAVIATIPDLSWSKEQMRLLTGALYLSRGTACRSQGIWT